VREKGDNEKLLERSCEHEKTIRDVKIVRVNSPPKPHEGIKVKKRDLLQKPEILLAGGGWLFLILGDANNARKKAGEERRPKGRSSMFSIGQPAGKNTKVGSAIKVTMNRSAKKYSGRVKAVVLK